MKNPLKAGACKGFPILAERTGLEPATPGVTGRYQKSIAMRPGGPFDIPKVTNFHGSFTRALFAYSKNDRP
jgi:hypothetical protein